MSHDDQRDYRDLFSIPRKARLKLAAQADVDERTIRRFLAGGPVKGYIAERITGAQLSKPLEDRGKTHPNLELRFLVMNYEINPNDVAAQLLRSFVNGRRVRPNDERLLIRYR